MILIFIFFIIFALLAYKRLFWSLCLILLLLPTYLIRFKIGSLPLTFLEGMVLILAAIWLFKKIRDGKLIKSLQATSYKLQAIRWPILLFFAAAAISVFVSPNRLSAWGDWRAFFLEPLIFFVIFLDLVKSEKKIKNVFYTFGGCVIYISLFTIFQIFTGYLVPENYLKEGRMTSFYGYPAAVGLFLAPILAMFIGLIIEKLKVQNLPAGRQGAKPCLPAGRRKTTAQSSKQKINQQLTINNQQSRVSDAPIYWGKNFKIFTIATIILSALALLATKTEGAYLGVLAAAFLILMFTPWRKWVIFGTLLISIIIFAIPPSRHYIIQKVTFSDVSGDVRLVLWQGTWRAIKAHPIFGGGLSGFPDLYKQYKEKKHVELLKYPHNIIFNFWSETGILGLFAFLWLVFEFFKKVYKLQATNYKLAIAAAMLCLLIYGLLDVPYFKNDLAILFWILMGLVLI